MTMCSRPVCPRTERSIPWTMCPLDNVTLTDVSRPWPTLQLLENSLPHHMDRTVQCLSIPDRCVPDRKFLDVASLGESVPWLFCPWPIHPIPKFRLDWATPDFQLPRTLALRSGGVLCVGRACIRRRGANPINLVRGVGEAGQMPHWSIRCRRPSGASCMLDAVQGWDTLVRGKISKGRFVQGAQHPRTFSQGHIGRGHINPASTAPSMSGIISQHIISSNPPS